MNVRTSQILTILLSSLFLLSCATKIAPIDVSITQVDRAPLILPKVDKISPDAVNWYILSDKTAEDRFLEIQEQGYDPVIFGVTDEGYKNLSINQKKIMNLIQQQQAVIDAYKKYYESEGITDDNDGSDD